MARRSRMSLTHFVNLSKTGYVTQPLGARYHDRSLFRYAASSRWAGRRRGRARPRSQPNFATTLGGFSGPKKSEQPGLWRAQQTSEPTSGRSRHRTWISWAKRSSSSREISVCVVGRRVAGRLFVFLHHPFINRADTRRRLSLWWGQLMRNQSGP
jgi:hypothetical protein